MRDSHTNEDSPSTGVITVMNTLEASSDEMDYGVIKKDPRGLEAFHRQEHTRAAHRPYPRSDMVRSSDSGRQHDYAGAHTPLIPTSPA